MMYIRVRGGLDYALFVVSESVNKTKTQQYKNCYLRGINYETEIFVKTIFYIGGKSLISIQGK